MRYNGIGVRTFEIMGSGGGSSLLWGRRTDILNYGVWGGSTVRDCKDVLNYRVWGRRRNIFNYGAWGRYSGGSVGTFKIMGFGGGSSLLWDRRTDILNYMVFGGGSRLMWGRRRDILNDGVWGGRTVGERRDVLNYGTWGR